MNFCKYTIILILLLANPVFSQEKEVKTSMELSSSYSYSGLNAMLGINRLKSSNEFGFGFRTSTTYFSRYNNPQFMGIYAQYHRHLTEDKKFNSFLNIHYGNLFRKLKSPIDEKKSLFQVHEFYFGYGLSYQIHKFYILNSINYGGIYERQMNFYKNEPSAFFHFGPMVKLSIKYEL